MQNDPTPLAAIGAGSWGTAVAIQIARCNKPVKMWGRDSAQMQDMINTRRNQRYLPNDEFPELLTPQVDFAETCAGCRDFMISVPSHAFRETLEMLKPHFPENGRVFWITKGLESGTGEFLHNVAMKILGPVPVAIVSGPTFAKEVAAGLPAAVTVASPNPEFAKDIVGYLHGHAMRAYTHGDIIGVQLGGAVKNVLAIAAGIIDGLNLGANTRAGMITRGLAEMNRLGMKLGAQRETFMGLAGLGDLVLTCTDNLSRNRRMGLALAKGLTVEEAKAEIKQVVEGVMTTDEVWRVAQQFDVDMPITQQVYAVLYEGQTPMDGVKALIARTPKEEMA
ncbi:MAG: NAD(P)-dependent glycerol-3-phosphate dehydrogenase [Gammaproteobacteria bacterium]|nr:NAD(P)-dependent glycerol-3-phosphate dehydrogenase [Gammaproteobacteria bacterium]